MLLAVSAVQPPGAAGFNIIGRRLTSTQRVPRLHRYSHHPPRSQVLLHFIRCAAVVMKVSINTNLSKSEGAKPGRALHSGVNAVCRVIANVGEAAPTEPKKTSLTGLLTSIQVPRVDASGRVNAATDAVLPMLSRRAVLMATSGGLLLQTGDAASLTLEEATPPVTPPGELSPRYI
jgi:hypothetical protein